MTNTDLLRFCVILFVFLLISIAMIEVRDSKIMETLNSVGIAGIVSRHNAYSNWNEIVWIKKENK